MQSKLIIDTDPGVDDAMALMLAIQSNRFDIQAITTVCGNATLEKTTRNTRYILDLLHRADIPVYSGAATPLTRPLVQALVHGDSGLGNLTPDTPSHLTANAVEKMLEIIAASPDEVTLVALGPLTNVARAMLVDARVMAQVKEVLIMGGAIKVPGNKSRVAEFNFYVDPEAAKIVFRFPVAKTLVPLDACLHVRLSLADFRAVRHAPMRNALVGMAETYIAQIAAHEHIEAALMYDPLTIFSLISPDACHTYRCNIEIETNGELTRGMSVADLRIKPEAQPNTTVIDDIDEAAFRKTFLETIDSIAP